MSSVHAVIFDLDGTLLHTLADLRDSTNFALAEAGFPTRTTEEIRRFVGNGIGKLIRRALPPDVPEEVYASVYAAMTAHYAKHCEDSTAPYPGILSLLRALQARGIRMAVVSNKVDSAVKALCARHFEGLIPANYAIGERSDVRRKPAPDSVFTAMRALGVTPEETIYVGDSEVDVQTAVNAGLPCLSALWGFRSEEELLAAGATRLMKMPDEVYAYIVERSNNR